VRIRAFFPVLMMVLALGFPSPPSVCTAGTLEPGLMCCCTGTPVCQCLPDRACKQSCTLNQVQSWDKQTPIRTAQFSGTSPVPLVVIVPTKLKYFVSSPSIRGCESKAALPFEGSPPQARLCLWRI
jgi:hypothetical protein